MELTRRDDLESLGYMLIYFSLGGLSWRETKQEKELLKQKMEIILNPKVPSILKEFIQYTRELEFKETPCYEKFINIFIREIECL
jgi:hypothetical protein